MNHTLERGNLVLIEVVLEWSVWYASVSCKSHVPMFGPLFSVFTIFVPKTEEVFSYQLHVFFHLSFWFWTTLLLFSKILMWLLLGLKCSKMRLDVKGHYDFVFLKLWLAWHEIYVQSILYTRAFVFALGYLSFSRIPMSLIIIFVKGICAAS